MNNLELARRALLLLEAGGNNPNIWLNQEAEAIAAIPYACHRLAERVNADPMRRGLLTQEYSITLTDGVGNPITATGTLTSLADMLFHGMEHWSVRDEQNNILQWVQNYNDFVGYQSMFYSYFTLYGQRIYTKQLNTGSLTSTTGPLTVISNFVPTITASSSTLPAELDDDMVLTLCEILATKLPKEAQAVTQ